MKPSIATVSASMAFVALGCAGGGAPEPSDGTAGVFVAFAEDFRGYHSWKSFDTTGGAPDAGIHDGSKVTEYIKALPPHGSKVFPVGTIIVKEATGGTIAHELFTMVKRGGGFNSTPPGAANWEWLELANVDDGNDGVKIVWRGFGPPANEPYGGDVNAGCNTCHVACGNDAVCAKPLALTNF
jgi:hypothetical protein